MKDLPRHRKKVIRQEIRSQRREEVAQEAYNEPLYRIQESEKQQRKQAKLKIKKEKNATIPSDKTPEEQNKEMKKRVPRFRPFSHSIVAGPK